MTYGQYWLWVTLSVLASLVFIVMWGKLFGSMIPYYAQKVGRGPGHGPPFVATLADVTGMIIYFSIAAVFLSGKCCRFFRLKRLPEEGNLYL